MKYLFLLLIGLFILSCAKPPEFPVEPAIEFLRLSSNTLPQSLADDEFVLATISFTDGDGDIGNDDNETTIIITDLRDSTLESSATILPKVPEQGANNGISGEITFRIFQSCCIYPPEFFQTSCTPSTSSFVVDTIVYEVYIIDRAGNESNKVQLEPIYLQCI